MTDNCWTKLMRLIEAQVALGIRPEWVLGPTDVTKPE